MKCDTSYRVIEIELPPQDPTIAKTDFDEAGYMCSLSIAVDSANYAHMRKVTEANTVIPGPLIELGFWMIVVMALCVPALWLKLRG